VDLLWAAGTGQAGRGSPQEASFTIRSIAGLAGFLTFIQLLTRPLRYASLECRT
jgi:hypothetical protein